MGGMIEEHRRVILVEQHHVIVRDKPLALFGSDAGRSIAGFIEIITGCKAFAAGVKLERGWSCIGRKQAQHAILVDFARAGDRLGGLKIGGMVGEGMRMGCRGELRVWSEISSFFGFCEGGGVE